MKVWLRKLLIILVSILTFGMITPSHSIWSQEQDLPKTLSKEQSPNIVTSSISNESNYYVPETKEQEVDLVQQLVEKAEEQALIKFGPKISPVIEDEFQSTILPKIEDAIQMMAAQFPDDELSKLAITEKPGGGLSERIFNIYHVDTGEKIMLFHVRREKPPLENFQFHFHYHTYHDNFETHYSLGTIQWSKDTPPYWNTV